MIEIQRYIKAAEKDFGGDVVSCLFLASNRLRYFFVIAIRVTTFD